MARPTSRQLRRSGSPCAACQIFPVFISDTRNIAVRFQKFLLQLFHMRKHLPGRKISLGRHSGCCTCRLACHGTSGHYSGGGKRDMGAADDSSSQEQILNIDGI